MGAYLLLIIYACLSKSVMKTSFKENSYVQVVYEHFSFYLNVIIKSENK